MPRPRRVLAPKESRERIARGKQFIYILLEFGYTLSNIGELLERSEFTVRTYRDGKVAMEKLQIQKLADEISRLRDRLNVVAADLEIK